MTHPAERVPSVDDMALSLINSDRRLQGIFSQVALVVARREPTWHRYLFAAQELYRLVCERIEDAAEGAPTDERGSP